MTDFISQIKSNLSFLLVTAAIIVFLALAAKFAERFLPGKRKLSPARRITIIALCGAIAAILHILDFPLPFLAPDFYRLDISELPVMLCGFYLGPSATVFCEAVKILLKLLLKGTTTAFVGDFANFFVGCAFALPAAVIYQIRKTRSGAVIAMVVGTVTMSIFGSLFNAVYLLPKFSELFGLPLDAIVGMGTAINPGIHSVTTLVMFAVVPLNLLKGTVVSLLTFLLYKRIARPLFSIDRQGGK